MWRQNSIIFWFINFNIPIWSLPEVFQMCTVKLLRENVTSVLSDRPTTIKRSMVQSQIFNTFIIIHKLYQLVSFTVITYFTPAGNQAVRKVPNLRLRKRLISHITVHHLVYCVVSSCWVHCSGFVSLFVCFPFLKYHFASPQTRTMCASFSIHQCHVRMFHCRYWE